MKKADISWYIAEEEDFVQDSDYYLGAYDKSSTIKSTIQIWNNRYGSKEIEGIDNAKISINFDTIEDSYLLNHCTINVNDGMTISPEIIIDRGVFEIGELLGTPNDGKAESKNYSNFKNITLEFKNIPSNAKNGLKNLYLDIEMN